MTFENNIVNDQTNDFSIFFEMDVTESYCKIDSVTYPVDRMNVNYGTNNHNVALKKIVKFNRIYTGLLDSIKPYINHKAFKTYYRIFILDTRYQRDHIQAQTIQIHFKFARGLADNICPALVLTRRIISVNSDGSKIVDIVS